MRKLKSKNTGKDLEKRIADIAKIYEAQERALIHKCDPPSRTINVKGKTFTTLLKNPFPDFVGTWTENGGKALLIEAKSTKHPRLPIMCKSGGVTIDQIKHLTHWHHAGAAVGIVWEHELHWRFVGIRQVHETLLLKRGNQPRRSIKWDEAEVIPQNGMNYMDFLKNISDCYK